MSDLLASAPELLLLLAAFLAVAFWPVIRLLLGALAVSFILLVIAGMAAYGIMELIVR
jgi:hypothetical protein